MRERYIRVDARCYILQNYGIFLNTHIFEQQNQICG